MVKNLAWPVGIVENTPVDCQKERRTSVLQLLDTEFCQCHFELKRDLSCGQELRGAYGLCKVSRNLESRTQLSNAQTSAPQNL